MRRVDHRQLVSLVRSALDYGNFVPVGLPAYLQRRLQSVLNAAARLVFRLCRHDHVSDALATLHWLRLPQRVDFKVAVMAFRVLHDFARHHHINCLSHHSGSQPSVDAHFQSLYPLLWNSLPSDIRSSPSLPVFRQRLTFFFRQSLPDIDLVL